jgi:hypothetical protein
MSRRTVFLGSNMDRTVDVRGPSRRSWPDIDAKYFQQQAGIEALAGAKAIALAYETDWDLVRVYFSGAGDDAAELLGPGRVLSTADSSGNPRAIDRIEPVTPAPATRLYDAEALRRGHVKPDANAFSTKIRYADGDYFWEGVGELVLYKWTGTAWAYHSSYPSDPNPVGRLPFSDMYGNAHGRAIDFSFDPDRAFTVADYVLAGLMESAYNPPLRSEFAVDAHGQPGDTAQPGTKRISGAGGAVRYADLSPLFYGRLAIDVFDACPPADYIPKLAPERFITFPDIVVPAGGVAPSIALLTFPVLNSSGVEFLYRNDGASAGALFTVIVSPTADQSIASIAGVPNTEADEPFNTAGPGDSDSLVLDEPRHPFCKILVGSDLGATLKGGILTIKREMDQ